MRLLAVTDAMPQKNWPTMADEHQQLGRACADRARDQPGCGVDEERIVGIAEDDRAVQGVSIAAPFFGSAAIMARFNTIAAMAEM